MVFRPTQDERRGNAAERGRDKQGSERLLSAALIGFGAIFCLIYPLALLWPAGWMWHAGPPLANPYYAMILGVYAVLGLFLIRAARNPLAHRSLIGFAIWSSLVHAAIMAVQASLEEAHRGHLLGDVPALVLVAVVLGYLLRRAEAENDPQG